MPTPIIVHPTNPPVFNRATPPSILSISATSETDTGSVKSIDHWANLIREKCACDVPGHVVCVETEDGHNQISEAGIMTWADSIVRGEATPDHPPIGVFGGPSNHSSQAPPSIDSSRRRAGGRLPNSVLSASLRFRPDESTLVSDEPSGALGPGYRAGQFMEWLGRKVIITLEQLIMAQRTWLHRYRLRRLSNSPNPEVRDKMERELLAMFDDALNMLRPSYSRGVNKYALRIAKSMINTPEFYSILAGNPKNSAKYGQISDCISTLGHILVFPHHQSMRDLAWELHGILTRIPLALQGEETCSAFICAIGRELSYSHYSFQHYMLGVSFCGFVEDALAVRPLSPTELGALHGMVARHLRNQSEPIERCRSWEVASFALCAARHPGFKDVVLQPCGVPRLFAHIKALRSAALLSFHEWCIFTDTLSVLETLLQIDWIVTTAKPEFLNILLDIFRHGIPKPHWRKQVIILNSFRCIRHIVNQHPTMLDNLIEEDAAQHFLQTAQRIPTEEITFEARRLTARMKKRTESIHSNSEMARDSDQWRMSVTMVDHSTTESPVAANFENNG